MFNVLSFVCLFGVLRPTREFFVWTNRGFLSVLHYCDTDQTFMIVISTRIFDTHISVAESLAVVRSLPVLLTQVHCGRDSNNPPSMWDHFLIQCTYSLQCSEAYYWGLPSIDADRREYKRRVYSFKHQHYVAILHICYLKFYISISYCCYWSFM